MLLACNSNVFLFILAAPYSGVMYQTAQGLVYATPGTSLQNGVILSLPPGIQLQTHNEANGKII